LVLPKRIGRWSLASLQHRLVKTGALREIERVELRLIVLSIRER
jgi:hypothetical protein